MQRSTPTDRRVVGTYDGTAGDGYQRGACKVDVAVSGPETDPGDGDRTVDLDLTARYPGRADQTISVTLPAFAAASLVEAVETRLADEK